MSEEMFASEEQLKGWLVTKGVCDAKAEEAAAVLFPKGFDEPDSLLNISSAQLENNGLKTPLAMNVSNKLKQQQTLKVRTLSHALLRDLWFSVLRVVNDATDEKATGLIFDIHRDEVGPFLLLILPKHFNFKKDELVNAYYCDDDGDFFLALQFTKTGVETYHDGGTQDLIFYKIRLDGKEWRTEDPGRAHRMLENPTKRMREDKPRGAAPHPTKRIDFMCKTPRISYEVTRSMPVNIFGFPGTYNPRWEGSSFVTMVNRDFFALQNLSAPGLSGGAVVASHLGEIIGFVGGAYDTEEKGKVQRPFESYAILARSLPKRPSSNPSSPDRNP